MKLSGNDLRYIYGQSDFAWNFDITPYSNNSYIHFRGASTSGGVEFYFQKGKVLDKENKFVWAYKKGDPLNFEVSASGGFYEYSINGIPINRRIQHDIPLDRIQVYIPDGGYLDYQGKILGSIPIYSVGNLNGVSGYSGQIINHGPYPIRIFNVSSPQDEPGALWSWTPTVNSGQTGWFKRTGENVYNTSYNVPLDFNFNFGDVRVERNVVTGIAPIIEPIEAYAALTLISGENPLNTQRTLNETYVLRYLYSYTGGGGVGSILNVLPQNGLTGDALVYAYGMYTGGYSGWLFADPGTGWGKGYLTGNNVKFLNTGFALDSDNIGSVLLDGPKQMFYENYLTGVVSTTFNPRNEWLADRSVKPYGNVTVGSPYQANYGLNWTATSDYRTYTGAILLLRYSANTNETATFDINSTSYQGKYVFNSANFQRSGIMEHSVMSGIPLVTGIATVPYGFAVAEVKNLTTKIPIQGSLYNGQVATGYIDPSWCKKLYISRFLTATNARGQVVFTGGTVFSGGLISYDRATDSDFTKSNGAKYSPWDWGDDWMVDQDYGFWDAKQVAITKLKPPLTITNNGLSNPFGDYYEQDEFGVYGWHEPFVKLGTMALIRRPDVMPSDSDFTLFYSGTNTKVPYDILNYYNPGTVSVLRPFVFTGILNTEVTGYIAAGYPKLNVSVTGFSNYYFKGPLYDYSSDAEIQKVVHYVSGTNILLSKVFRTNQIGTFTKTFNPPRTVFLTSGYYKFTDPVIFKGTGIFSGFVKNPYSMWNMYISPNDVNGPYYQAVPYSPPDLFYEAVAASENTIEGYIKLTYSGKKYDHLNTNVKNKATVSLVGAGMPGAVSLDIETSRVGLINTDVPFPYINGIFPGDGRAMIFSVKEGVRINSSREVYQWDDLSGNGFHATQGASTNRPIFNLNSVNGFPALEFDGIDDFFTVPAALNILRNRSQHYAIANIYYENIGVGLYKSIFTVSTSVSAGTVRGNIWINNNNLIQSNIRVTDAGSSIATSQTGGVTAGNRVIYAKHLISAGSSTLKIDDASYSSSYVSGVTQNAASLAVKVGEQNNSNKFNGKMLCLAVIAPPNPLTVEEERNLRLWAASHSDKILNT